MTFHAFLLKSSKLAFVGITVIVGGIALLALADVVFKLGFGYNERDLGIAVLIVATAAILLLFIRILARLSGSKAF